MLRWPRIDLPKNAEFYKHTYIKMEYEGLQLAHVGTIVTQGATYYNYSGERDGKQIRITKEETKDRTILDVCEFVVGTGTRGYNKSKQIEI